ncbi:MAG: hypothetical protein JWM72_1006 [Actinomycetia bacterium]|nr:hypothetical protein [Actinomycetes bacterium]
MAVIRFGRREPRLALAIIVTALAATALFSIAVLEAMGVVRVFAVVRAHADGGVSAEHMYGIEYPSRALTTAHERGVLFVAVAFTIWVLRLARRTAGYFIGGWRAIGLFVPPITVGVLAGALHAATEGVISEAERLRWHRLITAWCSITIGALILDSVMQPGWSTIESFATLGRAWSVFVGAAVAASVLLGVGLAARITWRWQHLTPDAAKTLERRLADLPYV